MAGFRSTAPDLGAGLPPIDAPANKINQLIDAGSGAHLWAEQFDTPRADLLQTQDAIVTHLARAIDFQLIEAEGARVKRTTVANRDAEDLALQCAAGSWKAGGIGKEADAAYALCEQALAIDPNNVQALIALGNKFFRQAQRGVSADPRGDLERADELESKALALDPDWTWPHDVKKLALDDHPAARWPNALNREKRACSLPPCRATPASPARLAGSSADPPLPHGLIAGAR